MPGDTEQPEGLVYREEFIDAREERGLLALLETLDFRAVTMRGQTARRTVRHYGLDYDYESGELVAAEPLPAEMTWLRDRCAAFMERAPEDLVQILVSRYPEGAGIECCHDQRALPASRYAERGASSTAATLRSPPTVRWKRMRQGESRETPATLEPNIGASRCHPMPAPAG